MMNHDQIHVRLESVDALIAVDLQNDFLPGGALAVSGGDAVIPVMNRYLKQFHQRGLPIFATRDWHPSNHPSFSSQGGPWPPHCIAGSKGAEFAVGLMMPDSAIVISKGNNLQNAGYSGFDNPDFKTKLDDVGARRLFIGGLATDYCVLHTVLDALQHHFQVYLLTDAIRAVNINPKDGKTAEGKMTDAGAIPLTLDGLE